MELSQFLNNVKIYVDLKSQLGVRLNSLLNEVISRLPDEEQFRMRGQIAFHTRASAIEFWQSMRSNFFLKPDFTSKSRGGNCSYRVGDTVDHSTYIITIIVDDLNRRSDDYVRGLIAHELSEMSYCYRATQGMISDLRKMKPKARQIRMDQLTGQNATIGTREHQEHENKANQEAMRLGFSKEIQVLDKLSG